MLLKQPWLVLLLTPVDPWRCVVASGPSIAEVVWVRRWGLHGQVLFVQHVRHLVVRIKETSTWMAGAKVSQQKLLPKLSPLGWFFSHFAKWLIRILQIRPTLSVTLRSSSDFYEPIIPIFCCRFAAVNHFGSYFCWWFSLGQASAISQMAS